MPKLIVGNLKMYLSTLAEREKYFELMKKEIKNRNLSKVHIALCPPSVYIETFIKKFHPPRSSEAIPPEAKNISIGAQNIFWEENGSYTGEISASMVKNLGGEYVIVGHSERRKYFSEDNEIANAKIKIAVKNGLKPIYCIGETKEQRLLGETSEVIVRQIEEGLLDIPVPKISSIIIAYEPVWAVGSDLIPTCNEILEVKVLLKKIFTDKHGPEVTEKIKILYGGSVNALSILQVCCEPAMDGVLIGRESLNPSEFLKIAEIVGKN